MHGASLFSRPARAGGGVCCEWPDRAASAVFDVSVASPPSRTVPTSPGAACAGKKHQARIDPSRLVFIDETWAKTNMTRTRGWRRPGKPLVAKVPHGHWKTLTFLAALRQDAITEPCVLDGPINGSRSPRSSRATSSSWTILVLTGQSATPSAPPAHGWCFCPPYSPHLKPIEQVFAKLKTKPASAPSRPSGKGSDRCSNASIIQPNALPTSETLVMLQSKSE